MVHGAALPAAVSFIAFPRESHMMSSTCVSSTVKTPFPGLTAELGIRSFCSHNILSYTFPSSLTLGVFFSHSDSTHDHTYTL